MSEASNNAARDKLKRTIERVLNVLPVETFLGLPVVKKESDAYALYDVEEKEIMAYAPGVYWPLSKSKALRERGTGHRVVYLGFPASGRESAEN